MKTKVDASLPITEHDLEETKKYANQVKKWLEEKGYEEITPFDACSELDKLFLLHGRER